MRMIDADTYVLFYSGNKMVHSVFHNGARVINIKPITSGYIITLYNGTQRKITAGALLDVSNTNKFTA